MKHKFIAVLKAISPATENALALIATAESASDETEAFEAAIEKKLKELGDWFLIELWESRGPSSYDDGP